MTHIDRFKGLSSEAMSQAQESLNELCNKYGLKPWAIDSKKGNWKELCFRMCGLYPMERKRAGRKPHDKEFAFKVWYEMYGHETANDFDDLILAEQGLPQPRKMQKKEMYARAAENNGIEEKPYGAHGKISNPSSIARGIHQREKERRYQEMCEDNTPYDD